MDDFEKSKKEQEELNENEGVLNDEAIEDSEPEQTFEDGLVEELEGIRDMLQTELDKANDEPFIQELDEITDESAQEQKEEIPQEELCECCGERRKDSSFGEDYPYCGECRNLMKAFPIKPTAIFSAIIMFVVAAVSLYFCASSIDSYMSLLDAETYYSQHKYNDAAMLYSSYLSQKGYGENVSLSAVKHLAEIFEKLGYLGDAKDTVENHFPEALLKLPWNAKYSKISDEFNEMNKTSNEVVNIIQDVLYASDKKNVNFEEKDAELLKLLEPDENGVVQHKEVFVEYYRFVLMSLVETQPAKQLEQLYKVEEMDKGEHLWLYLPNIIQTAARMGDTETAEKYFERCMKINVQESIAYTSLANAYRFNEKIDANKILDIAKSAEENASANDIPSFYQIYAIGYLLQGKNEEAMKAMESYMNAGAATGQPPYTIQSCNLYALCSLAVENEEGYKMMEDIFSTSGVDIADSVKKFKNGKISIEDVLKDNGGEI